METTVSLDILLASLIDIKTAIQDRKSCLLYCGKHVVGRYQIWWLNMDRKETINPQAKDRWRMAASP
jgi:hypothetical protein